jgi:hypothetical protein
MRKRYSPELDPSPKRRVLVAAQRGLLDSRGLPRVCAQCSERRVNLTKLGQFSRAVQLTERGDFSKV